MADLADVVTALKNMVLATLYPAGAGGDYPLSTLGCFVRLTVGMPDEATLKSDMAAGYCGVSVTQQNDERNTTRYLRRWIAPEAAAAPLTVTVAGPAVTFAGAGAAGLLAGLVVDHASYVTPVGAADTPATVAAALAALIAADRPASAEGGVLTAPGVLRLVSRIGQSGTALRELHRQERTFQVICWAPSPALRDQLAQTLDPALSRVGFLALPDGSSARLVYAASTIDDTAEQALTYRRDLDYRGEWSTFESAPATTILFPVLDRGTGLDAGGRPPADGGVAPPGTAAPGGAPPGTAIDPITTTIT